MSSINRVVWVGLLVGWAACNETGLASGTDGGGVDQASGFCSGNARVELNGMRANSPSVDAQALILNCCDGAELSVISMQISDTLVFSWRRFASSSSPFPVTVDLAKLPSDWSVSLSSGCTSLQQSCQPTDTLTEGFTGSLTVDGDFNGYTMSVCLQVREPASKPHPVLHDVQLWSPTRSTQ